MKTTMPFPAGRVIGLMAFFVILAIRPLSHAADIDDLTEAARAGDLQAAMNILASGIDVNAENSDKLVPIVYAAANGHVELVKLLIRHGADPDAASSESGSTALHLAAQLDQAESVDVLLESGADINMKDKLEMTPLIKATYSCKTGIIALLLKRGADPSISDIRGETALMAARRRYDTYIALFKDRPDDQQGLRRLYGEVLALLQAEGG